MERLCQNNLRLLDDEVVRKKAIFNVMVQTAVQSHFNDIQAAIHRLKTSTEDIKEIEKSTQNILRRLQAMPDINKESYQIICSMNIAETVEKTRENISRGYLITSHQNITKLENARNCLMRDVHKLQSADTENYKSELVNSFGIEELAENLSVQLSNVFSTAGSDLSKNVIKLNEVFGIIKEEEELDSDYKLWQTDNGFMPPGRPKNLQSKLFAVLKKSVSDRFESIKPQRSSTNWVVVYLQECQQMIVADLTILKKSLELHIFNHYLMMYHSAISKKLTEIASNILEKQEIVQLLAWIRSYGGHNILGNYQLEISTAELLKDYPLLTQTSTNQLFERYTEIAKQDIHGCWNRALDGEKEIWYSHAAPEDENKAPMPTILFRVLADRLTVIEDLSLELLVLVIDAAMDELSIFSTQYKEAAMVYKTIHFKNKKLFGQFTATMIVVANNIVQCSEQSSEKLENVILRIMEPETIAQSMSKFGIDFQKIIQKCELLKKNWNDSMQSAVTALAEDVYEDIRKDLKRLMTIDWLIGSNAITKICDMIVKKHDEDYQRLRPHIRDTLMEKLLFAVIGEYIIAINDQRLKYKSPEARERARKQLRDDAGCFKAVFTARYGKPGPLITEILMLAGDIINCLKGELSEWIAPLVQNYPDVTSEFLAALINSREDVNGKEAKAYADAAMELKQDGAKVDQEMAKLFDLRRRSRKSKNAIFCESMYK